MIRTTIETMLETTVNTTIDAVQTSKKMLVDTFVKHKELATSLNEFVDTQTAYTKNVVEHTAKLGKTVQGYLTNPEFYKEFANSAQEYAKTLFNVDTQKGK